MHFWWSQSNKGKSNVQSDSCYCFIIHLLMLHKFRYTISSVEVGETNRITPTHLTNSLPKFNLNCQLNLASVHEALETNFCTIVSIICGMHNPLCLGKFSFWKQCTSRCTQIKFLRTACMTQNSHQSLRMATRLFQVTILISSTSKVDLYTEVEVV